MKSLKSDQPISVTFENKSGQSIEMWWHDFEGKMISYGELKPNAKLAMNTFATHPWSTPGPFLVNGKQVWVPEVGDNGKTIEVTKSQQTEEVKVTVAVSEMTLKPEFDDSTSIREFFYMLAEELGKQPQDTEPFVKALEDDWITTIKVFKALSQEELNSYSLPKGLLKLIQIKFECEQEQKNERLKLFNMTEKDPDCNIIFQGFKQCSDASPATRNATSYEFTKLSPANQPWQWCGWRFHQSPNAGNWFRMSAWVKFIGKVPPRSPNFGFKIQGNTINEWVTSCKPDEWTWVSLVGPVIPGGDGNHVIYIFDSVKGPQTVRLSQLELEIFEKKPEPRQPNQQ